MHSANTPTSNCHPAGIGRISTAAGAFYSQMECISVRIVAIPLCVSLVQFQVPIQDQNRLRMSNWIWPVSRGQFCTGSQSREVHSARADMYANIGISESMVMHLCSWTVCISVRACCTWGTHSGLELVVESASPEHRNSYLEGNSDQAAPVVRPISRRAGSSWPLHATLPTSLMHA